MKNKLKYIVAIAMVIILAACGPAPTPTMSSADVQGTAVAAAWTVVAMTQAAIPTATPVPPTETASPTPLPTFTPLAPPTSDIPTQPVFGAPTTIPAGGATLDPCNAPIAPSAAGHKALVQFVNKSGGSVILSFGLTQKTKFGECGYYALNINPNDSPVVRILEGTYWAGAFITGKRPSKAFGGFTVRDDGHKWQVTITSEVISIPDK